MHDGNCAGVLFMCISVNCTLFVANIFYLLHSGFFLFMAIAVTKKFFLRKLYGCGIPITSLYS